MLEFAIITLFNGTELGLKDGITIGGRQRDGCH
jgi:hypothetical protein